VVTATDAAAARRGAAVKTATAATAMKPTAASTVEAASTATAVGTTTASATVATAAVLSECRTWRGNERNPKKCSEEEFKKCRPCHVFALHQQPVEPTKAPVKSLSMRHLTRLDSPGVRLVAIRLTAFQSTADRAWGCPRAI